MYSAYDHLAVGLPHSDIRGSTIARISPRLFAACYVLHRLLVPRHPPNALQRLISTFPRNHPGPCGSGRPISLLIPLQPRQPSQDARTHNSALAKPSIGIPIIGLPPRSPDAQFSFKHSTLFQKPAHRAKPGPKPSPATTRPPLPSQSVSTLFTMSNSAKPPAGAGSPLGIVHDALDPVSLPIRTNRPTAPCATALVEADGIEPTTPCLQSRCSPTELRPQPVLRNTAHARGLGGPGKI
jgi:hypothetical protein